MATGTDTRRSKRAACPEACQLMHRVFTPLEPVRVSRADGSCSMLTCESSAWAGGRAAQAEVPWTRCLMREGSARARDGLGGLIAKRCGAEVGSLHAVIDP